MPLVHERRQLFDQVGDTGGIFRLALDQQVAALRADTDVEQRFEIAEVIVVRPDEGFQGGLGDRDLAHRGVRNSRISLDYSYLQDRS